MGWGGLRVCGYGVWPTYLQCDDETDWYEVVVEDDKCEDGQKELTCSICGDIRRGGIYEGGYQKGGYQEVGLANKTCTYCEMKASKYMQ